MRWEQKLANQAQQWSPEAPSGGEVTIEGDEIYTRVGENHSTGAHGKPFPPVSQKGGQ